MKVALIQCPVWGTREPPLAIVQLSACLKAKGFAVKSFDFSNFLYKNRSSGVNTLWAWEQCMSWYDSAWVEEFFSDYSEVVSDYMKYIVDYNPDVVGFSISASTYQASRFFSLILKQKLPDIKVVFGGPAFVNEEYVYSSFKETAVDFIIPGETDELFPYLVKKIDKKETVKDSPGFYIKQSDEIKYTGDYDLPENMDKLPYMDFSDLKLSDYDDPLHVAIMSSRGCIWKCAYCSTCNFNKGYRMMSAERIHQEITYHRICNYDRNRKDNLGHIDFFDLEFNGNIQRVEEFCDLMIKYPPCSFLPQMKWVTNAVIHPGLTKELLTKMAFAGCKKLIFGIESGSERVLKLMRKPYKIEVAKRVIREAYNVGIEVTTNFMFGFPGETEEDFQLTLDFVKDVGKYIERVYPSRTYCAVEQYSYLEQHLDEFGIKTPVNHHLYWETLDGENIYPVRLERCTRFEDFCNENGVRVDCGVKTAVDMDNWFNLAHYYEHVNDYPRAAEYFLKYLELDPANENIKIRLSEVYSAGDNAKFPSATKQKIEKHIKALK